MKQPLTFNSQTGYYEGTCSDGKHIRVDQDEIAEALTDAIKDGSNEDIYDPDLWATLYGVNPGVDMEFSRSVN